MPDELSEPSHVHKMLGHFSPAARRVSMKRFKKYWQDYYPDDTRLKTLLELWASQGLVAQATDGYTLEPDVQKAIDEGLIPVAAGGRLLAWIDPGWLLMGAGREIPAWGYSGRH